MFNAIGQYSTLAFNFAERGLAHPTFLGRAVSWGIFYGVLYIVVKKVCQIAFPVIKKMTFNAFDWCAEKYRKFRDIPEKFPRPIRTDSTPKPSPEHSPTAGSTFSSSLGHSPKSGSIEEQQPGHSADISSISSSDGRLEAPEGDPNQKKNLESDPR